MRQQKAKEEHPFGDKNKHKITSPRQLKYEEPENGDRKQIEVRPPRRALAKDEDQHDHMKAVRFSDFYKVAERWQQKGLCRNLLAGVLHPVPDAHGHTGAGERQTVARDETNVAV